MRPTIPLISTSWHQLRCGWRCWQHPFSGYSRLHPLALIMQQCLKCLASVNETFGEGVIYLGQPTSWCASWINTWNTEWNLDAAMVKTTDVSDGFQLYGSQQAVILISPGFRDQSEKDDERKCSKISWQFCNNSFRSLGEILSYIFDHLTS